MEAPAPLPFVDLGAQRRRLGTAVDAAIARVVDHGSYILGPEVAALESALADHSGAPHCITCANGTDALVLALLSEGIGPGDAVFVPAFTFVATAEAVVLAGATPVFVDVAEGDFALCPHSLAAAVAAVRTTGLAPRAVIPVDLFGLPADYKAVAEVAHADSLLVIADAAQSFGAVRDDRRVGTMADITTTSFFPAKPLGCYGDGGALFTADDARAARLRSLRMHGQGTDKYHNVRIGLNSRLDTIQAAVLLEKLRIFDDELRVREIVAARYAKALEGALTIPATPPGAKSAWALYTVRTPRRDAVAAACKAAGVPTGVYYPITLNRQPAYRHYPVAPAGVPVAEGLAVDVLSLPIHPYLDEAAQDRVVAAVLAATSA